MNRNVVGTCFRSNAPRRLARRSARGYEKPFYKWVAAHSDAYLRSPPTKKRREKNSFHSGKNFCVREKEKERKKIGLFMFSFAV